MVAPATRVVNDETLPVPWKALIDGATENVYYWNTATNETTYVRPASDSVPPPTQSQQAYAQNGHTTNGTTTANGSYANAMSNHGSTTHGDSVVRQTVDAGYGSSHKRAADPADYGASYNKRPRTTPCTSLEAETYRKEHEITVLGENVPLPYLSFDSASLPPEILKEIQLAGFAAPTPIQAQSWPIAIAGRDIVAVAKTGSGKTLGYLLPAFLHLQGRRNNASYGPTVLVLAPTRELATQIHNEATKFGRSLRLNSVCVYGGTPRHQQLRELDRHPDIVIATPGRLNDFLEAKKISLRQVSYLVLDEADRMLDMGFEPQIRKVVAQAPPKRQTLMYTATWPKEVRRIAADLLTSPAQVNIGNTDDLAANKSITQIVEIVLPYEKTRKLEQILRSQEPGSKIIVFCSTKRMCDDLARNLRKDFGAAAIHGDKSQTDRDWVLSQFKSGRSPILVATDVAARGLDIKDIRVVVNYDFPTGVEDYVHRIGRTGRAGATGLAHTFFSEQDGKYAKELIKVLEGANQKVPAELRDLASRGGYGKARGRWDSGGGRGGGRGFGDGYGGNGGGRSSWGGGGGRYENGRGSSGWGNGNDDRSGGRSRSYDRHDDRSKPKSSSPYSRGGTTTTGTGGDNSSGFAPGWDW